MCILFYKKVLSKYIYVNFKQSSLYIFEYGKKEKYVLNTYTCAHVLTHIYM